MSYSNYTKAYVHAQARLPRSKASRVKSPLLGGGGGGFTPPPPGAVAFYGSGMVGRSDGLGAGPGTAYFEKHVNTNKGALETFNQLGQTLSEQLGFEKVSSPRKKSFYERKYRSWLGKAEHSPESQAKLEAQILQEDLLRMRTILEVKAEEEARKHTIQNRIHDFIWGSKVIKPYQRVVNALIKMELLENTNEAEEAKRDTILAKIKEEQDKDPMLREGGLSSEALQRIIASWRLDEEKLQEFQTAHTGRLSLTEWLWGPNMSELMKLVVEQVRRYDPTYADRMVVSHKESAGLPRLNRELLNMLNMHDWTGEQFVRGLGGAIAVFIYSNPVAAVAAGSLIGGALALFCQKIATKIWNVVSRQSSTIDDPNVNRIIHEVEAESDTKTTSATFSLLPGAVSVLAGFIISVLKVIEEKRARLGLLFRPFTVNPTLATD